MNTLILRRQMKLRRVFISLFLTVAAAFDSSAQDLDRSALCWRDFPIPTTDHGYEHALASETIPPAQVKLGSKTIRSGMTEGAISEILGNPPIIIEDWAQRTPQGQCEYLLQILRKYPNTMHLYSLASFKGMSGYFRVAEWELTSGGKLRAFFHKPSPDKPGTSFLYHLTFPSIPINQVQRKKGGGYVLIRSNPSVAEWNVQTNQVSLPSVARR